LHLLDLQLYRAERAERRLPPSVRRHVLREARTGRPPAMIAAALGIPVQRIWAYARTHPVWLTELDDALMEGRDPGVPHGSAGYRQHGCFCPVCRSAHRRHDKPRDRTGQPARRLRSVRPDAAEPGATVVHAATGWVVDPALGRVYTTARGQEGRRVGTPAPSGVWYAVRRRNGEAKRWNLAQVVWEAVTRRDLPSGCVLTPLNGDRGDLRWNNLRKEEPKAGA
ncbi:MAG TPA: hypothetical protein VGL02_05895, partial [Streptomyces sp.]